MLITKRKHKSGSAMRIASAVAICLAILIIALMTSPVFLHWFIIPLFACGLLCCLDGIQLLENRGRNLFDPVPLLGCFGLYFFYVAPLLHVGRDYWFINKYFAPTDLPEDWRTWLGWMGVINLFGLMIYRACHKHFAKVGINSCGGTVYQLKVSDLRLYGYPLLALTLFLQLYIYARFGGLAGYMSTYGDAGLGGQDGFAGLGWMLSIAESFPLLLLIVFIGTYRGRIRRLTIPTLGVMLGVLFALTLLFGGLRGSRSNTVFALMYAVGIIHALVRRLPWRFFAIFGVGLVVFMYIYGFYKISPQTFLTAMTSSESRANIAEDSGRNLDGVLLGDLERADIQAYLLFRIMQGGIPVQYAFGQTYIDAVLTFVPRAISSYRPPGKLLYGTNAMFGEGAYSAERFSSSKVYGLSGEAMLNIGLYGIPIAFFVLGMGVGRVRALCKRIEPWDSRQYALPVLSLLCVVALSSDFDNVIYTFVKHALMPGVLIWCASSKKAYAVRPVLLGNGREEIVLRRLARR